MKTFKCTVQDSLGHVTRPKQPHSRPTATRTHLLHLGLWIHHHFLTQSSEQWDKRTATNPNKSSPCGAHVPLGAVPVCALDQTPARFDDIRLAKGWEWAKVEQLLLLAEQKISWCPAQHLQIYKTNKRMTDVMDGQMYHSMITAQNGGMHGVPYRWNLNVPENNIKLQVHDSELCVFVVPVHYYGIFFNKLPICITGATAIKLSKSQQQIIKINQPNVCPRCFPKKLKKTRYIHPQLLMLHL